MATKKKKEISEKEVKKGIIHFSAGCILEITLEGIEVSIKMKEDGKQLKGSCTLKEE